MNIISLLIFAITAFVLEWFVLSSESKRVRSLPILLCLLAFLLSVLYFLVITIINLVVKPLSEEFLWSSSFYLAIIFEVLLFSVIGMLLAVIIKKLLKK